jgi:glycosyltransferase involved in cell wall biosynthesis
MQDMASYLPKITVVTPSYNQGRFIEATIRSVLLQDYPSLEYIIMDGNSSDETISIIRKYGDRIDHWESVPDHGQAHAINKGFSRATGEVLCWLNSDDLLMPEALRTVGRYFRDHPTSRMITGGWIMYFEEPRHVNACRPCGIGLRPTPIRMLGSNAYLGQHSTFWRRDVVDQVGLLNESLHYAMDHEFFTRCVMHGVEIRTVDDVLAVFRQHKGQKTATPEAYAEESQKAKAPYESGTAWEKMRIRIFQSLRHLMRHRNIHPRLGLYFDKDEDVALDWIRRLQQPAVSDTA